VVHAEEHVEEVQDERDISLTLDNISIFIPNVPYIHCPTLYHPDSGSHSSTNLIMQTNLEDHPPTCVILRRCEFSIHFFILNFRGKAMSPRLFSCDLVGCTVRVDQGRHCNVPQCPSLIWSNLVQSRLPSCPCKHSHHDHGQSIGDHSIQIIHQSLPCYALLRLYQMKPRLFPFH
jgi:hypothetical protein